MRRSMMCLALISLSMAVLLGPAGPAGASGVETLDLERYYYPIGTSENGGEQAVVFRTVEAAERALEQTWSIYLTAEPRRWKNIRLQPGDPKIGTLHLRPGSVKGTALASFAFTVPQMPVGDYILALCTSAGCRTSVGDLYTSTIEVVESAGQARIFQRLDQIESRQWTLRSRLRETRRDADGLRRDIASNEDDIAGLTADRDALRARLRAAEKELERPASPVPWVMAALLFAIVVMGAVRRLRPTERWERYFEPDEDREPVAEEIGSPMPSVSVPIARASEAYDDAMWRRPTEPADSN